MFTAADICIGRHQQYGDLPASDIIHPFICESIAMQADCVSNLEIVSVTDQVCNLCRTSCKDKEQR